MALIEKTRNRLRGVIQRWGTAKMKQELWNSEYAGGRWKLCKNTQADSIYHYLSRYCNRGTILELGCGSGNTGCELEVERYRRYTGVDISDVAIQVARRNSENSGRSEKNRYVQSDILTYVTDQRYNVILFRESIYYIALARLKVTLDRYKRSLTADGVFIVTVYYPESYKKSLSIVECNYEVLERYSPQGPGATILVFR